MEVPPEAIDVSINQNKGVMKMIIKEGHGDEKPGKGNNVIVHYVGKLLNGTEFDSSRTREQKFEFNLGLGRVIKAWDEGVATMKKGELAVLYCQPEYAYGEKGSPPKIPPNACLIFEVELFDWKGEDVSENKDGSITKNIIKGGAGWKNPNEGSQMEVELIGKVEDTENIFENRSVSFVLGEGIDVGVLPGVEQALKGFKKGEKSKIVIEPEHGFGAEGNMDKNIPPNATLVYEITLTNFEKAKELWEMSSTELLEQANVIKNKGSDYFKREKYQQAIKCYNKVLKYLEDKAAITDPTEVKERDALLVAAHLNLAAVYLKLPGSEMDVINHCSEALQVEDNNVKGLFRRSTAYIATNDFEMAINDLKKVLEVDANNKAAKNQLAICTKKLSDYRRKEKKTFAGMFDRLAARDTKQVTNMKEKTAKGDDSSGDMETCGEK